MTSDEVRQAAAECGVTTDAIRWRIRHGWSDTEVRHTRKPSLRREMAVAARELGLTVRAIEQRFFAYRWPLAKALTEPRRKPFGR